MTASSPDASGRVLVLGAGLAGLGAARCLHDAGTSVTVIEGRSRIGGRVHTSHLWRGLPVELGANWIHGFEGNPVSALASQLGVQLTPTTHQRSIALNEAGCRLDLEPYVRWVFGIMRTARGSLESPRTDVSLMEAITSAPEWLSSSDAERRLMRLIITNRIEHDYGGDWNRLSAISFDDDCDFPGGDAVLSPGYEPIIASLAQGLDVSLEETVFEIAPTANGSVVTTSRGLREAEHVIVTFPLGILKSGTVKFIEPLATSRQRAIERLEVGLLNKCCLRFERAFWPGDVDWVDYVTPAEQPWGDWASFMRCTGAPLFVGFNSAKMAAELETLDDRATTASAMEAVRAMFGQGIPEPVGSQVTRWQRDPFSLGSYSFTPVGTSIRDRSALFGEDWDGRLYFAGEASSPAHPGTTHGALITGRQAARAVAGMTA